MGNLPNPEQHPNQDYYGYEAEEEEEFEYVQRGQVRGRRPFHNQGQRGRGRNRGGIVMGDVNSHDQPPFPSGGRGNRRGGGGGRGGRGGHQGQPEGQQKKRGPPQTSKKDIQKLAEYCKVAYQQNVNKDADSGMMEQLKKLSSQLEALSTRAQGDNANVQVTAEEWRQYQALKPQLEAMRGSRAPQQQQETVHHHHHQVPPVMPGIAPMPSPGYVVNLPHPSYVVQPPTVYAQPVPVVQSHTGAIPRTPQHQGGGQAGRGAQSRGGKVGGRGGKTNKPAPNNVEYKPTHEGKKAIGGDKHKGNKGRGGVNTQTKVVHDLIELEPSDSGNKVAMTKRGQRGRGGGNDPNLNMTAKQYIESLTTPAGLVNSVNFVNNLEEKKDVNKTLNTKVENVQPLSQIEEDLKAALSSAEGASGPRDLEIHRIMKAYFDAKLLHGLQATGNTQNYQEEEIPPTPPKDGLEELKKYREATLDMEDIKTCLPENWELKKLFPLVKENLLVKLAPELEEFHAVFAMFNKSIKNQLHVVQITRIESPFVWHMYRERQRELTAILGYKPLAARFFHGTDGKDLEVLFEQGFAAQKHKQSAKKRKTFGHGVLIGPNASDTSSHCPPDETGLRKMLVVQCIQYCFSKAAQKRQGEYLPLVESAGEKENTEITEETTNEGSSEAPKQAVKKINKAGVDENKKSRDPRIIARFDEYTCYPEYVIHFWGDLKHAKDQQ